MKIFDFLNPKKEIYEKLISDIDISTDVNYTIYRFKKWYHEQCENYIRYINDSLLKKCLLEKESFNNLDPYTKIDEIPFKDLKSKEDFLKERNDFLNSEISEKFDKKIDIEPVLGQKDRSLSTHVFDLIDFINKTST